MDEIDGTTGHDAFVVFPFITDTIAVVVIMRVIAGGGGGLVDEHAMYDDVSQQQTITA